MKKIILVMLLMIGVLWMTAQSIEPVFLTPSDEAMKAFIGEKEETIVYASSRPVETPIIDPLDGLDIGTLVVSRLVVNPNTSTQTGFNLAFNLETFAETVKVLVVDELNQLVGEFNTAYSSLEVMDNDVLRNLHIYKVSIDGLDPDTSYKFVIQMEDAYSQVYDIKTLALDAPTKILFLGDAQGYLQSQYDRLRTTYEVAMEIGGTIDLCVFAGDIVDTGDNFAQWQYFDHAFGEITQGTFILTPIGNHEVYGSEAIFLSTFNFPDNGVDGLYNTNYYVDLPFARVAVINTEAFDHFSEQKQWLEEVMADYEAGFRIVLMHRSAYPLAYDEPFIRKFASIFEAAKIDLVLSGHDHIYSRTTMDEGQLVELNEGVTYLVGGSPSGSKYYDVKDSGKRYWKDVVYDANHPVFTQIEIDAARMTITAYSVIEGVSQEIDSFIIE